MKTVRVRLEGDVDCADDLTREDLYRMFNDSAARLFKAETITVEVVSIEDERGEDDVRD